MAKAGREPTELMMTQDPSVDTGDRADEAWLLSIQRKLYQWSEANPDELLSRVVELGHRPAQLEVRLAADRLEPRCSNRRESTGRRWDAFARQREKRGCLQRASRTTCDRHVSTEPVSQEAGSRSRVNRGTSDLWVSSSSRIASCRVRSRKSLEPIFEATFWHVSYGFRRGEAVTAPWSTSAWR